MQAKWLWVGLAIAVATPAMAQPAAPAAPARKVRASKAPKAKPAATIAAADLAALSGANVEAAAKAAEALGAMALPAAHDALLDALALGLAPAVAVPAITAVSAHPAPNDVVALVRYARHLHPAVRSAALAALALYPSPVAQAVVVAGLRDQVGMVRGAAAAAAARGRIRAAVEPLFVLLARGEEPAGRALAALADADLARKIAEQLGKVPDATLAVTLGAVLKRPDLVDPVRVEVVRAIGKIQDPAAITALTGYLDATPKTPPRTSRQEAAMIVEARVGGGK